MVKGHSCEVSGGDAARAGTCVRPKWRLQNRSQLHSCCRGELKAARAATVGIRCTKALSAKRREPVLAASLKGRASCIAEGESLKHR